MSISPLHGWPPGPSGLQALRYLGWRRELISFTERCRQEYGGICGIRFLKSRICLISDPHLIEKVFVTHASRVKKWDTGQFDLILGKGLLTSNGELWKRQRSLIQPVFQPARLEEYSSHIVGHTDSVMASWAGDSILDVHEEMLRLSLKIASSALFGSDSTPEVETLISEMQHLLMKQFSDSLSGIPIPLGVPTPANLRTKSAIRKLDEVVLRLIERRRAGAPAKDFLGALLAAQDDDGIRMSDQQIRDECMTMLLAGHETTGLVLTWTLWLLASNPGSARELAQEIDSGLGTGPVDAEQLGELGLLRNVLSESMRLYPPVWAIGRVNIEPIDLGEYTLPSGTQIFLVPYIAHRDGAVFENPLEFRPRRWEDPKIRGIPRCSYMPFGSGPRKCVGMHFAVRESLLILALLLRRFSFETVAGRDPVLQASVTLRPSSGLHLRVKARHS